MRRPPPRAAEVHRAVLAIAAENDWPEPSYPVVRRITAGLDRGLVTMLPQSLLTSRTAIFTPCLTMTARQLLNEVIHRVAVLSGDIERSFNAHWDPFDDIQLESDSRTELLIIEKQTD